MQHILQIESIFSLLTWQITNLKNRTPEFSNSISRDLWCQFYYSAFFK